jgi:hypothetical protein
MRSINKIAARALRPAILAVTCLVIAGVAVTRIVQSVRTTPHVGDILAFVPSPVVSGGDDERLLVHRQNQFGCVLDLSVLRRSGGSLIVETEIGGGASNFRVHWAGQRTSTDTGNCGSDADLVVDRRELNVLALSAGGYGVGSKRISIFTGGIGN